MSIRISLLALMPCVLAFEDLIKTLPTYGPIKTPQYAGFVDATKSGDNTLHYWFAEAENKWTKETPFLVWLNGGPGSSSLTGLLAEKLGPQSITSNATLVGNPDRITKKYHLLTVDNPVGSGYSQTTDKNYVKSEEEMRTQFVYGLEQFFARHPEYAHNPLWITGESYAGHYVPNIAYEIAVNSSKLGPQLQGIIVGNGMYNMKLQYPTIGAIAYSMGIIDERTRQEMKEREVQCLKEIDAAPDTAGDFCENVTVRWLFSSQPGAAGEIFYYDVGMEDAHFFDTLTDAMSKYLNRPDVRAAVHAGDAEWVQADEVGPVADNLLPDWTVNSDDIVAALLARKLRVRMYNGVRDASSCNHIGNLQVLLNMDWEGQKSFVNASNIAWPSMKNVQGHIRKSANGLLSYATVLRTGHLVPTVVPRAFATLLDMMLQ